MTNKLCSNCKHFAPDVYNWSAPEHQQKHAICSRTSTVTLLTGKCCRDERAGGFFPLDRCGKKARFFEEREQKP